VDFRPRCSLSGCEACLSTGLAPRVAAELDLSVLAFALPAVIVCFPRMACVRQVEGHFASPESCCGQVSRKLTWKVQEDFSRQPQTQLARQGPPGSSF